MWLKYEINKIERVTNHPSKLEDILDKDEIECVKVVIQYNVHY